jgi:prevent-host-death family protein
MTLTEAVKSLGAVVERARDRQETTVLLKNGKPVARIVPVSARAKTGRELAAIWPKLRHLSVKEATAFDSDLAAVRRKLLPLHSAWE